MTRFSSAAFGLMMLLLLIVVDFSIFSPNPYQQPALFALGSGVASDGGFCGSKQ